MRRSIVVALVALVGLLGMAAPADARTWSPAPQPAPIPIARTWHGTPWTAPTASPRTWRGHVWHRGWQPTAGMCWRTLLYRGPEFVPAACWRFR